MRRRSPITTSVLVLVIVLVGGGLAGVTPVHAASSPIRITGFSPGQGSTVRSTTPVITVSYVDTGGILTSGGVTLIVDGRDVSPLITSVSPTQVVYDVLSILPLNLGNTSVNVTLVDLTGHETSATWNFTVNPNAPVPPAPPFSLSPGQILLYAGIGVGGLLAAFGAVVLYLRLTRHFSLRRYIRTHPLNRTYLFLYLPAAVAVLVFLVGISFVYSNPGLPLGAPDVVAIIAAFVGLTPFGLYTIRQKNLRRAYERAFAQFLFEMSDAMRGGIDPARALVELSKSSGNILRRPLRIAADGIRMGRPFEKVLTDLAAPLGSPLIRRYAGLIADASVIGGETAVVVYRAAKDMDDFVKIEEERAKELSLPVAIIYIAFIVLLSTLIALLFIAPSFTGISLGIFTGTAPSSGSAVTGTATLTIPQLHERFFELMLINAAGTGAIIGAFTDGKARYGIMHSLALIAVTGIVFIAIFP